MVERMKWDAWNALGGMSKEEAVQKYLAALSKIAPDWEKDVKAKL